MSRLKAPERRSQLISVATQLFAERGFDATTTAAIAAAAGVSEPILYRHFRSKQELFAAIVNEVTSSLQVNWSEETQMKDADEAFRAMCREWPRQMQACACQYRVIQNALTSSKDPIVVETLRGHYAAMEAYFMALVKRGQDSGIFRKELDTKTAAWWMIDRGIGYTLMTLSLGPIEGYDYNQGVELTLRALMCDPATTPAVTAGASSNNGTV